MTNADIARVFLRIAELMSYREEGTFKIRAYYRAALTLSALDKSLAAIAARNGLESIPGIGEAISGKIGEILSTGTCNLYERLKSETPEPLQALIRVPGLTPRLARFLERDFKVSSVEEFVTLARKGGLSDLEGLSLKVEDAALMLRAAEALGALDAVPAGDADA